MLNNESNTNLRTVNKLLAEDKRDCLRRTADQLFFVIGASRSGTTLLQVMISSHPDIIIAHETRFYNIRRSNLGRWGELHDQENFRHAIEFTLNFSQIRDLDINVDKVSEQCLASKPSWETIFLAILTNLAEKYHATRVGEKTPSHIHSLGLLKDRFPNAKFIHIVRDPRAVISSQTKLPHYKKEYYNIVGLCKNWHSKINCHRKYSDLIGPERYTAVKYEDLVANPEMALRTICDFINIEFSSKMLEYHKRDFPGFNLRKVHMQNTLKPVFKSSVDKWCKELSPAKIALIEYSLLDDMCLLGYEPSQVKRSLTGLHYRLCIAYYFIKRFLRKIDKMKCNLKYFLKRITGLVNVVRSLKRLI